MGIAEKIKDGLKQTYRIILIKNIKKILNIISSEPLLSAYGQATFASKSDKSSYLQYKSLQKAYSSRYPVAYGSLFLPFELFHALGLAPFLPEVIGGFTGGLGLADRTLKEASSRWYTPTSALFTEVLQVLWRWIFSRAGFIICTNIAYAAQKTLYRCRQIWHQRQILSN